MKEKTVGEKIRELRTSKKIPLRKLASALDIDTSSLAKMEKNERPFSLKMVPVIAKELGINYKQLQIDILSSHIIQEIRGKKYALEGLQLAIKRIKKK